MYKVNRSVEDLQCKSQVKNERRRVDEWYREYEREREEEKSVNR